MSLPAAHNDLSPEIQTRLKTAANHIRDRERATKKAIFEIGEILIAVKTVLDHGQFGKWISREFGWTSRTATNYMAVVEKLGAISETVSDLPTTTLYGLAAMPDAERGKIVAMITDPKNPPMKQIKKEISTYKAVERVAKMTKIIEENEARRSPAAKKAEQKRKEERAAAQVAAQELQSVKDAQLKKDATELAAKMDPDILDALLTLTKSHYATDVIHALLRAKEEIGAVDNVVTITGEVIDDELKDFDFTTAA
ncbi:MAG: DUF3102 domain-containing protein [Sulfitobacter sp.]|uniref:DUF3102 domain-containing protein n=1 Tax=Sulfitobacter sp. TaxID=1903071 RepID=UPI00326404CD